MKPDSVIHLRVPAATKGRWVQASRAADKRLTDWIVEIVETHMEQQMAKIAIPDDLEFCELHLVRNTDGSVGFDWTVIERICEASRLPVEIFREGSEDNVAGLIVAWYQAHRQHGGEADPVAEDLIAEATAEAKAGQSFSHDPGHA